MNLTRQEAGYISFDVTQDPEDKTKFHVHEIFRTQDDFDFHQQRAQASPWAKASKNVERHYDPLTTE